MRKISKKEKTRILLCFFLCLGLFIYTGSLAYNYWTRIISNQNNNKELNIVYSNLLADEAEFKAEMAKLENPDYVAKYAREKYLYSKEGEKILRIIK